MKILFLTVMPSPYQRQLFAALAASSNLDVEVRYFTVGAHDREWDAPKFEAFEKAMAGHTIKVLGPSAHLNSSVIREIEQVDADLVVVSDYSAPTAQMAMWHLARHGKPFVFWGEVPGFSQRGKIGTWVRSQLQRPLEQSSGIAAIGKRASQSYAALFPGKPIFDIPYFCDLAPYQSARQHGRNSSTPELEVLFSGQLIDRKGVDVLLEAFIRVAERNPNIRLRLLGSGPEKSRYMKLVPDHLSDRVVFSGHKDPAELPATFAEADIFCLPSRHDGWGVVINEALGSGLPIIVSDAVGAGHDLVQDGINGIMTPAGDVSALAAAIARLGDDHALRSKFASQSAATANSWGLDEGVRRWKEAAKTVLSKSQKCAF